MITPSMVPDFRARLHEDAFLVGTWITILDPTVPELMAGCGFDFLVADGEHGAASTSDFVEMLIAARAAAVPFLFRVGANEPVRIMHALDNGASGVVVPQVRTPADVERAVAWCRYPPAGLRGISPRRASGYGRATSEYMSGANALVTCCIQIETHEALDCLDDVLAVPGIDTILVGPNDLAASIGHTGDITHPDVEAAISRILQRAAAFGVPAGIWAATAEDARRRREQGFRWVTVGADYGFLLAAAETAIREVRRA